MRDLVGFIYLIFVCITAYGVVSRALFLYNTIDFTAKSVFYKVFYRPYWFLYSIVDQEITALDSPFFCFLNQFMKHLFYEIL